MSGATTLVAPGGALAVQASDDPNYTLRMSFDDTANDSALYVLDFDIEPYVSDGRVTLLVEYGPRNDANSNFSVYTGIRAGTENTIPMVAHNGGSGTSRAGIWGGVFDLTTNSAAPVNFPVASSTSWVVGAKLEYGIGDATTSPVATGTLTGPVTSVVSPWPTWLDINNPSSGDFAGASCQTAAPTAGAAARITNPPRVPGPGLRIVIRPTANLAGAAFTDQYVLFAAVRPDAGMR